MRRSRFLNLEMAFRRVVRQRQAAWIVDAGVRPKSFEEARRFERQKTAVGAGPQRAIKQHTRGRRPSWGSCNLSALGFSNAAGAILDSASGSTKALTFCLKDKVRDAGLCLGLGRIDPQNIADPGGTQGPHRKGLYRSIVR
jgi:hypothetical protein